MNHKKILFLLVIIVICMFGFLMNTKHGKSDNSDIYLNRMICTVSSLDIDATSCISYENALDAIPTITVDRNETVIEDYRYDITNAEFDEFVRVVEAEVTGLNPWGVSVEEAFESKLRVAQVILNRIESPRFPDNMHDVIFQRNAFTPLVDGRYYDVEINDITIEACKMALRTATPDLTEGCEFFSSGTTYCKYGSYVFTDSVGHSFFKSYKK